MAGTVIRGTVLSRTGDPIVEARVYFTEAPVPMTDIAALTNEEGSFSVYAPAVGTYRIECTAEGFQKASQAVEVSGDQREVTLVIELAESNER